MKEITAMHKLLHQLSIFNQDIVFQNQSGLGFCVFFLHFAF